MIKCPKKMISKSEKNFRNYHKYPKVQKNGPLNRKCLMCIYMHSREFKIDFKIELKFELKTLHSALIVLIHKYE